MMQEKESGRILQCIGGIYTVATDSGTVSCKARGVFRKRGMTPYAGDFVTVEQGVMTEILPRKNSIIRPPLANLDQLLFVTSTYKPVPNLLLLDQFMAVAIYKQIQPVLVLTKLDLQDGAALQELYTNAGIPVYPVCYDQPDTLEAVRACLRGKVSALTGNSGAGKSTLLNALYPDLQLKVGEISEKLGRGRHTTRQASLYPLDGGYIADTPGFSTFEQEQYARIPKEELADCFPEFAPYQEAVGFRTVPMFVKRAAVCWRPCRMAALQKAVMPLMLPCMRLQKAKGLGTMKRAVIFPAVHLRNRIGWRCRKMP